MRRVPGPAAVLPLLLLLLAPAGAEEPAALPVAPPGASWVWRPGHPELVRWGWREGDQVLEALDPASGTIRVLAPLGPLRRHVARTPLPVQPIGRAPAPVYRWSEDGRGLLVVSNGDLVWYEPATGFTRRLTETASPLVDLRPSPDGRHVAFARENDLWVVSTRRGEPRPLTFGGTEAVRNATLDWLYPEEFDLATALWWSPRGDRLAYLQMDQRAVPRVRIPPAGPGGRLMRYPRAGEANPRVRVGVVPVEGGATTWLDLGDEAVEYVVRVAWFPDGERVAVVVLDRAQQVLRLLACPADGTPPVEVLRDEDPAWVDVPPAPRFLEDGRFLWRARTEAGHVGWFLVAPPTADGPARRTSLTDPEVDVPVRPHLTADGATAHYVARVDEGLRRRPRVGVGGEEPAYAPPPGHDVEVDLDATGTWAMVSWSATSTVPRTEVRRVADGRPVHLLAALNPTPSPWRIETGRLEGPIHWRLWHPSPRAEETAPSPRPLVALVYGGPGHRRIEDRFDGARLAEVRRFLDRGWFVLEAEGRGTPGFGLDVERAVRGRLGLPQIEDVARAVAHFAQREDIDADRVAILGWSFGGTMACLGVTHHPEVFRAGVALAPVTDWRLYDTAYTERFLGLPAEAGEAYAATSPVEAAHRLAAPLLLLHGDADDNVHVLNATRFAEAVERAGREGLDLRVYPGVGHDLGRHHAAAWRATLRFLEARFAAE